MALLHFLKAQASRQLGLFCGQREKMKYGVRLFCYYSQFLSSMALSATPVWLLQTQATNPMFVLDSIWTCANTSLQ